MNHRIIDFFIIFGQRRNDLQGTIQLLHTMASLKKIGLIICLLFASFAVQAQGAAEGQPALQKPTPISNRAVDEYVGEVFSIYHLVRALEFDLTKMESEVAGMEIDAALRSDASISSCRQKLGEFLNAFNTLQKGHADLSAKMVYVQEEGASLQPANLAQHAGENLAVTQSALDQAAANITTQIAKTNALIARAQKL